MISMRSTIVLAAAAIGIGGGIGLVHAGESVSLSEAAESMQLQIEEKSVGAQRMESEKLSGESSAMPARTPDTKNNDGKQSVDRNKDRRK